MRADDPWADNIEKGLSGALGGGADIVRRDWDAAAAERAGGNAEGVYLAALLPMK